MARQTPAPRFSPLYTSPALKIAKGRVTKDLDGAFRFANRLDAAKAKETRK